MSQYKITQSTVQDLCKDHSQISYPRFQRADKWKNDGRFNLFLSMAQACPIGAITLSKKGRSVDSVRLVIDGRQRYETCKAIYSNPEVILFWAKETLKVSDIDLLNSKKQQSIYEKFSTYKYRLPSGEVDGLNSNDIDDSDADVPADVMKMIYDELICSAKGREFWSIFYLISSGRSTDLDEDYKEKVRSAVNAYCLSAGNFQDGWKNKDFDTLAKKISLSPTSSYPESEVKDLFELTRKLEFIFKVLLACRSAIFAVVELEDASPVAEMNAFRVMNSGGIPLTITEVLSSDKSWDKQVDIPDFNWKDLYIRGKLKTPPAPTYWDACASLLDNLSGVGFVFNANASSDRKRELGFRVTSAILQGGVSKKHLEDLPKFKGEAGQSVDLVEFFKNNHKKIQISLSDLVNKGDLKYFRNMSRLGLVMQDMYTEGAITLFTARVLRKTEKDDESTFFALIDYIVYSSLMGEWKGSGDAKIKRALKDGIEPVSDEAWRSLIDKLVKDGRIGLSPITDHKSLKPLLSHLRCIDSKTALSVNLPKLDTVDHGIASSLIDDEFVANNISNLALMSATLNERIKGGKHWEQLDDNAKDEVADMFGITRDQFDQVSKCSPLQGVDKLKVFRVAYFSRVLNERKAILKQ